MLNGGCDKLRSDINSKLIKMNSQLKDSFTKIKEEFDDHIQAINDNTSEMTVMEGSVCEIDKRLSKVEEGLDNIQMLVKTLLAQSNFRIELNHEEQKLFLLLYTADEPISIRQISKRLAVPEAIADELVMSMTDKGIPLNRSTKENETNFILEDDFKTLQAREKIIKIDPEVTRQYQNKLLYSFFSE